MRELDIEDQSCNKETSTTASGSELLVARSIFDILFSHSAREKLCCRLSGCYGFKGMETSGLVLIQPSSLACIIAREAQGETLNVGLLVLAEDKEDIG